MNKTIATPTTDNYPQQIRLSAAAEDYLYRLGDAIASGQVALTQLPQSIYQIYFYGYWAGNASHDAECQKRIDRLTWERDLFYFQMANRGKTAADFYARATTALWELAS